MAKILLVWILLSTVVGIALVLFLYLRAGRWRAFFVSSETVADTELTPTKCTRFVKLLAIALMWSYFPALAGFIYLIL